MSNYWIETGAVIMGGWLMVVLTGVVAMAIWHGIWPLWFVCPPLLFCYVLFWNLWKTRPSVQRRLP